MLTSFPWQEVPKKRTIEEFAKLARHKDETFPDAESVMNPPASTTWARAMGGLGDMRGKVGEKLEGMAEAIKDAILDWEGTNENEEGESGLAELPPLEPVLFVAALREKIEDVLWQMAEAVNEAPTGQVVSASELRVRELLVELYREALELGLQMRLDAAEASMTPSQRPHGRWAKSYRRLKAGGSLPVEPDHELKSSLTSSS
jgi:hypothetical protein